INRDLQGALEILLAGEGRRQRVDDERHDIDRNEGEKVTNDRGDQGPDDRCTEQDLADESAHRGDSGEDRHVIAEQVGGVALLAGDPRPFLLRRQNDSLPPLDQSHRSPPLVAVDYSQARAAILKPTAAKVTPYPGGLPAGWRRPFQRPSLWVL